MTVINQNATYPLICGWVAFTLSYLFIATSILTANTHTVTAAEYFGPADFNANRWPVYDLTPTFN